MAAFLGGSYARGMADAHSDLDLASLVTDEAYDDFVDGRFAFVRRLGEPLFVEDFDSAGVVFFIFSDGSECELAFARESDRGHLYAGPARVLLDKTGILTEAPAPSWPPEAPDDQVEALRRLIYWFWHDLSHFITAMARGHLWWAHGQLDTLRRVGVDLLRLQQDFSRRPEAYDKVDLAVPAQRLVPLQDTYCPLAYEPMLQAGRVILRVFLDQAPTLARRHNIRYPAELERLMIERLDQLDTRGPVGS
jgi:predicted nucleotidyltransferase